MPTPALDIVFFDIDDTLYSTTAFAGRARRAAIAAMIDAGLAIDLEQGVTELSEVVAEFASNYGDHFGRLMDRLGPKAIDGRNPAVLVAAGVVAYHRTKTEGLQMLPDVRVVLEGLHRAGLRLGVISAGLQVKQAEKLIRLDALQYFDPRAIFFSDQLGVSKPNPKIYRLACERAGVDPTRAMYVGDRPTHDVAPAAALGMKTVLYRGAGGKYQSTRTSTDTNDGTPIVPDHDLDDMRPLTGILADAYGLG